MPITAVDLKVLLSGGSANTNPNACLGGLQSTTALAGMSVTNGFGAPLAGVTITSATGFDPADGGIRISYVDATSVLKLQINGSAFYGDDVPVSADGTYFLQDADGLTGVVVTVVFASLPVADANADYTLAHPSNNLFDLVTQAEVVVNDVEYRCVILKNTHASLPMDLTVWVGDQPTTAGVIAISIDGSSGPGGAPNPTAIANESTAPGGQTFTSPTSFGSGLNVTLPSSHGVGLWVRRTLSSAAPGTGSPVAGLLSFAVS